MYMKICILCDILNIIPVVTYICYYVGRNCTHNQQMLYCSVQCHWYHTMPYILYHTMPYIWYHTQP